MPGTHLISLLQPREGLEMVLCRKKIPRHLQPPSTTPMVTTPGTVPEGRRSFILFEQARPISKIAKENGFDSTVVQATVIADGSDSTSG